MNLPAHPPFSDWLFSEDPLESEQVRQLQEHLRACESCRRQQAAWAGVANLLQHASPVAPAAGFSSRWQARLAEHQAQLRLEKQRNIAWGLFIGAGSLALLLLGFLTWQVLGMIGSPAGMWAHVNGLYAWFLSALEQMVGFFYVLLRVLPPPNFWVLFFTTGLLCLLSVLWVVVYQQLTMRRVTV